MAVSPQPNPETVAALLDTAWRVADAEISRTDALDRKAATLATFASLLTTLTATLATRFVELIGTWWALGVFCGGLLALVLSVAFAVKALVPSEYVMLGARYLERLPAWSETSKSPEQVRGETLRAVIRSVARERGANDAKTRTVRRALVLLVAGLVLIAFEAADTRSGGQLMTSPVGDHVTQTEPGRIPPGVQPERQSVGVPPGRRAAVPAWR